MKASKLPHYLESVGFIKHVKEDFSEVSEIYVDDRMKISTSFKTFECDRLRLASFVAYCLKNNLDPNAEFSVTITGVKAKKEVYDD